MEIRKLIRPHLLNIVPYSSARDEFTGSADIYLDANENAFGSAASDIYRRYPDPHQIEVKKKLSRMKHVTSDQVFLGNGSDEPIDLLIRAFCNPGKDRIITTPPTYGMYEVSANISEVGVLHIPLTDTYALDQIAILDAVEPGIKIIFLCSPNNPTGNSMDREVILHIVKKFQGLVVVDEAYIDFSTHDSLLSEIGEHSNLVVLQTFSKAWGMAGLRLGMLFANPEIVAVLNKIKPPYNINEATQQLAIKALESQSSVREMVRNILRERKHLYSLLSSIEAVQNIHPSDANFLLVKIKNARVVYQKLKEQKVIVRDRSGVALCEDCLRITVGTAEENEVLAETINKISL